MFKRFFKSEEEKPAPRRKPRPQVNRTQKTRKQHQKINAADLRVGMFVVELDKPWEESGFMLQGLEVKSASDIHAIQKECSFVWVDFDEFSIKKAAPGVGKGLPAGVGATLNSVSVEEEFDAAKEAHTLASNTVSNLFDDIRSGNSIDGGKVKQVVNGCVDSILRNPDASVWLTRIQNKDQATAQHSLNVAAFSIVMAKAAGMSQREMEDVGVCGMLHDVGKTRISAEVLSKTGKLTPEEMGEMRKHTVYGRDMLISTKSVMSGAADVAYAHHEREDGQGYPRKLVSDNIPLFAKIVGIAEAYDTMTTQQTYKPACSPSEALQELYAQKGKQFDEDLVITFIDAIGIFPPGSIVEMLNGEIGIVLGNTSDKLRPRVIIILDAAKEPVQQQVKDLSQMATDNEGKVYQVKTTLSDGSFGIDVADFQRAGLRMG